MAAFVGRFERPTEQRDIEMSSRLEWRNRLFEADHSLLGRPVQRQVDMRGEFQIGLPLLFR